MRLTFIHAADFHLGADLHRFGPAHIRLESAQFEALERTLLTAIEEQAAFVLICGDLFDRRNPPAKILKKTAEIGSRFPSVPIYILPGTHDFLGDHSVFSAERSDWLGDNMTVLNEAGLSPYHIPHTDCYLYFRPNRSNRSTTSPIAGLSRGKENGFHIGLAHGSLRIGGLDVSGDFPIERSELESCRLDYLALGHWHCERIETHGRTVAAYCGTAQPISFSDPAEGSILVVRLEDTGEVTTQERRTSAVTLKKISAVIHHPSELAALVEREADPNTIVKLALRCSDKCNELLEVEEIISKAESRFLFVQFDSKNIGEFKSSINPGGDANEQLVQAFRAEIMRLREADSPERSGLYDRAVNLGVAIITGEM